MKLKGQKYVLTGSGHFNSSNISIQMRLLLQEELHNNTLKVKKASCEFSQNSN
jgi:hypothetical protein